MASPLKKLTPWQESVNQILFGGIKQGQVMTFTSSRRTGKSKLNEYLQMLEKKVDFEVVDRGIVDDTKWYVVRCRNKEISKWVRTQPAEQWYEHIDQRGYMDMNVFDLHEEVYAMLKLSWS